MVELVSSQNAGHALVFSGTQIKTDQHGYYEFSVKTGEYDVYAQVNQRRDVEYLGRIILNADVTGELTIEQALALTAPILPESVLEVRQHLANIQRLSSQVQSQHDTVQRSLGTVGQHADQVSVWAQQTHTQADRALGHANLASEQSTLATQQATRAQTQASAASDSARLAQEAKVALDGAVDRFELKTMPRRTATLIRKRCFRNSFVYRNFGAHFVPS
ncbi:hypothetical protein [Vibrio penaeicida]|uniref:hypothetical protein n=1 Tax=Vibrio penaeicida TaxID=104609 RepID=UPI001CC5C18E|nr:hypothetical protein [Vibrio penaeicida]